MEQLEKGGAKSTKASGTLDIGVTVLPKLPKDPGDRNRTSPFAFTGNKFEFRAVGGSQSIAGPNTVLNTIVAESLDFFATSLEKALSSGKGLNTAIGDLLTSAIKESKKVLFSGDGYSDDWHKEAAKRGLPNLKNTVDSLPVIVRKDSIDLFTKYKVYTENELKSRYNILVEQYVKTINVEAKLMSFMGKTMIVPACLRYQIEVGNAIAAAKGAGADATTQVELMRSLTASLTQLQQSLSHLDEEIGHEAKGDPIDHARHSRDKIVTAMVAVRTAADKLETMVSDDLWPIPTYREMLFIR
jgi:glutamine synthetase